MSSIALLAGVLLLAGCGNDTEAPSPGPSGSSARQTYVALGDSYTAAPGVGDPVGPSACRRTSLNYPHLVAADLSLDLRDASCGGAKTSDLTGQQVVGGTRQPPQLDALTTDTGLVTLSIGANDQNIFGTMVVMCERLGLTDPTGSPCADAVGADDPATMALYWSVLERRVAEAVTAIRQRAPKAHVLVVGYPDIFPEHGNCAELPFAVGDVTFAYRVMQTLDGAIRAAARHSGADYVDIWAASRGHDICSDDPWVAGVRPVHPAIAYHPYAAEERAVADLIVARVGSQFTG